MNLSDYFEPVNQKIINEIDKNDNNLLGNCINIHTKDNPPDDPGNYNIAIIGITDTRNLGDESYEKTPDIIRSELYNLYTQKNNYKIQDLGNLKNGSSIKDTYFAVKEILVELMKKNVVPVLLSGGQEFTYAGYQAFEKLERAVNLVSVNSRVELDKSSEDIDPQNFLSRLILSKSNFLFNYTNIAYQTYLVNPDNLDLLNKILFDSIRLGEVRTNICEMEPYLRDADILNFNINAIRQADAPGQKNPSANGLTADEACRLARYAGVSDKLSVFGLFGLLHSSDNNSQTANLAAQIIWHFFDGYYNRKNDYPYANLADYKKFIVTVSEKNQNIVFYKSPKTDRWWLEVVIEKKKDIRKIIVACSQRDYQLACNKEIPDRWWKTFQKIC